MCLFVIVFRSLLSHSFCDSVVMLNMFIIFHFIMHFAVTFIEQDNGLSMEIKMKCNYACFTHVVCGALKENCTSCEWAFFLVYSGYTQINCMRKTSFPVICLTTALCCDRKPSGRFESFIPVIFSIWKLCYWLFLYWMQQAVSMLFYNNFNVHFLHVFLTTAWLAITSMWMYL